MAAFKKISQPTLIASLMAVNIMIIVASAFMTPLWAVFSHRIGGTVKTAGNAIALFSIVIGLTMVVSSYFQGKWRKEKFFFIFSQLLATLSYSLYFWVQHPWQLYIVQVGLGVAGALQAPAIYSLYHQAIPKARATFYWGMWTGGYNIAVGTGAIVSAYITQIWGFTALFMTLLGLNIFNFIFCCILIYRMRGPKAEFSLEPRENLKTI